jgi:hypothetical protein
MTYAVSGFKPAKSDAERGQQIFEVFDTLEQAINIAETNLRNGAQDLAVWKLHGRPSIRSVIEWEQANDH